ncbi:CpsD/CapB family tyrosine-protein kinase [Neobacillus sp. D3-1R]|uniref:CpsD/CapB family tyrosine-protein kinase n=1 Tax=Neobacillus sp. D3-1R TaxID=3445778 RepID=UPI003F9F403B
MIQLGLRLKSNQKIVDRKKSLIAYFTPDSVVSEQYRSVKANIYFTCRNQNIRTILITSPSGGEGKSTTAANLAVSMAQQSERVLLIDANLRNPSAHLTFKIQNTIGLTSILNGVASIADAIHKSEIGRLDVLPSGPVPIFPSELLASKGFIELQAKLLGTYDYVLIDSPSLLEVADTKILASHSEGVILVLNPAKSKLDRVREARRVLEIVNAHIVGVILNEK